MIFSAIPVAIVPLFHDVIIIVKKTLTMAGTRIKIMELRHLIRLKKEGISNRKIVEMLRVSRNTVNVDTPVILTPLSGDIDLQCFGIKEPRF